MGSRSGIAALVLWTGCDFAFRIDHVDGPDARTSVDASPTPFAFVQSNFITQDDGKPVDLDFPGAQAAGNLNVVIIGWASAGAVAVSDDTGNTYLLARGAMTQDGVGQAIYYAENIASGTNRVHVTFTASSASSPDVRILEYAGPVRDGAFVVGNTTFGTGTEMVSDPLTVTAPHTLLVAGFTVNGLTQDSGPDYTERVKTSFGHLVEDREAFEAGAYTASAVQNADLSYVVQLVAFALQ